MTTDRPVLLDLFCGAGGTAVGYHRAGFDVVGVDMYPQPHYPFHFVRSEVFEYMLRYSGSHDIIHASPPCQAYSRARNLPWVHQDAPDWIEQVRYTLQETCKTYVIENVQGAPLVNPLLLCGSMFSSPWHRHRLFESNVHLSSLSHEGHRSLGRYEPGKVALRHMDNDLKQMGLDWMTKAEKRQSIPPIYTEYIGNQLINVVRNGGS